MEDLGGYVITGVVMFVVGLLVWELERKAMLCGGLLTEPRTT